MDIYYIKSYGTAAEFLAELESRIRELEQAVREAEGQLNALRQTADRYRRLQEFIRRFRGGAEQHAPLEITGLQIYVDPSPMSRYELLEESYKHMVDTLGVLKKVKEVAEAVIREGGLEGLGISVQYKNGVPIRLLVGQA